MRFDRKVALVTGAAQGQGRSHAVHLAAAGADIIAVDICQQLDIVPYPMGTVAGLTETVRLVEEQGRRIHAVPADVRCKTGLGRAVDDGVASLGRLDLVAANAAVCTVQPQDEITEDVWQTTLDTNLTGVWNTCAAAIPHLSTAGGGSIVITGSTASSIGLPFYLPYAASKHALTGVARTLALELSDRNIRVNMLNPTGVDTAQGHSEALPRLLEQRPDLAPIFSNTLPIERVEPIDVTRALLFLLSDEARYITGITMPVDAGSTIR